MFGDGLSPTGGRSGDKTGEVCGVCRGERTGAIDAVWRERVERLMGKTRAIHGTRTRCASRIVRPDDSSNPGCLFDMGSRSLSSRPGSAWKFERVMGIEPTSSAWESEKSICILLL